MDIKLKQGSTVTIKNSNGNPIVTVNENGTVSGAGTKLYKHHIQFETEDYIELFNTSAAPIISGTFNADNAATLQTAIRNAVSTIINLGNQGGYSAYCRPIEIVIQFVDTKATINGVVWNNNLNEPQLVINSEEVTKAFDTVTLL